MISAEYRQDLQDNPLKIQKTNYFQRIIREVVMSIIGREREYKVLEACVASKKPEFLIVFGRRRVGKTYLIREFFHERFSYRMRKPGIS